MTNLRVGPVVHITIHLLLSSLCTLGLLLYKKMFRKNIVAVSFLLFLKLLKHENLACLMIIHALFKLPSNSKPEI